MNTQRLRARIESNGGDPPPDSRHRESLLAQPFCNDSLTNDATIRFLTDVRDHIVGLLSNSATIEGFSHGFSRGGFICFC